MRDVQTAGIGDILVRGKWAPWQTERGADRGRLRGAAADGRPGTADGTDGVHQVLFLGSATAGIVSPHVNLSYQFGGAGASVRAVPNGLDELVDASVGAELGYTVGVEIAAHPSVTLSADLLGRSLRNAARFRYEERGLGADQGTPETRAALAQLSQLGRASVYSLNPRVGNLNRWLLAVVTRRPPPSR